jgi:hypothetical protein
MSDRENNKAPNKENKRNEVGRPEGKQSSKKNPPKYENFNGEPIE